MRPRYIYILLLLLAVGAGIRAYAVTDNPIRFPGGSYVGYSVDNGDTTVHINVNPIYVFTPPRNKKEYERLVKNVKKVYPYALEARAYMASLESELESIKSSRKREQFIAGMEKEIVRKYTPVLEKMTFTQGKILIKLIDRETSRTPYQILRQFRGRLTAGFYNTIAKIFKANLNQHYDPSRGGEDAMIEQIVTLIEAGLL